MPLFKKYLYTKDLKENGRSFAFQFVLLILPDSYDLELVLIYYIILCHNILTVVISNFLSQRTTFESLMLFSEIGGITNTEITTNYANQRVQLKHQCDNMRTVFIRQNAC